jgi:uncharacterized protein (DUF924 family)
MNEVLAFWFSHRERWWRGGAEFDEEIRRRFGALHAEIADGQHEDWRETPAGALAYVIVLDQFSRNMFRGDARAYRSDDRALAVSLLLRLTPETPADPRSGPAPRPLRPFPSRRSLPRSVTNWSS